MKSILITGCNRGLGLGLVKSLIKVEKPPKYIFATCRNIEQANELNTLADQHSNIHVLQIDLIDMNSYDSIVDKVTKVVKDNGLNVLFNNAGIAPKSTRLPYVKSDDLVTSFVTNTAAPIILTKAFLPLLKQAASINKTSTGIHKAAVINMTSILGSISSNAEGGLYPYRTSKAALNAATKSMSIDLKDSGIMCVCLHPGWVKTDMGGKHAPLNIETSCDKMIETLFNLTECNNGNFMQYDGKVLSW